MRRLPALALLLLPLVAAAQSRENPEARLHDAVIQGHWRTRPDGSLYSYAPARKPDARMSPSPYGRVLPPSRTAASVKTIGPARPSTAKTSVAGIL
jgi:hypothetical protein